MEGSIILRRRRRTFAKSPWTQERIEYLAARWSEGASALQISRELGPGISRNAVLGTIHRFGIVDLSPFGGRRGRRRARKVAGAKSPRARKPGRSDTKAVGTKRVRARKTGCNARPGDYSLWRSMRPLPAWVANAKPYVDDPGIDAGIPLSQRRSFLELTDDTCRWPVGDPCNADFFFCGAQPLPDKPYCAAHCARADWIDEAAPACAPNMPAPDNARDQEPTEREGR
jgi:GcrA cell cycle regulator